MKVVHVMDNYGKLWCGRKIIKSLLVEKDWRGTHVPLENVCLICANAIGKPHYDDNEIGFEGERRHRNTYTKNGIRVFV